MRGAQCLHVGDHVGIVHVERAAVREVVASLGDCEGDHRDVRASHQFHEAREVIGRLCFRQRGDELGGVAVVGAGDQGVQPVLRGERLRQLWPAASKRGVAPLIAVFRVLGVPNLVSAVEGTEA